MSDKKLFIVETITTYRHRYAIEAAGIEDAKTILLNHRILGGDDFDEVTQKYLGETIMQGREITKQDFDQMLKDLAEDTSETSSTWMGDKLIYKTNYDK